MTQDIEIRLSGSGGQGLGLSGRILAEALTLEGRSVAQSQSYEPTSRGGLSRSDLVAGDDTPDYPLVTALDFLLVLDQCAVTDLDGLIKPSALVLADSDRVPEPPRGDFAVYTLPFTETARTLGNERIANIVALAALVTLGDLCPSDTLETAIRSRTPKGFLDLNLEAMSAGLRMARTDETKRAQA